MTLAEVFMLYSALKRHFTSDYDYFKYNGRVKISEATFVKQLPSIKHVLQKLRKHKDPEGFIIANLLENPKLYILELNAEKAEECYQKHLKISQSLMYSFKEDLNKLDDVGENIKVYMGHLPLIIRKEHDGKINFETLAILVVLFNLFNLYSETIDDPMWFDVSFKIKKYLPFINYNKELFIKILKEKINDQDNG